MCVRGDLQRHRNTKRAEGVPTEALTVDAMAAEVAAAAAATTERAAATTGKAAATRWGSLTEGTAAGPA